MDGSPSSAALTLEVITASSTWVPTVVVGVLDSVDDWLQPTIRQGGHAQHGGNGNRGFGRCGVGVHGKGSRW